jgi:hypothetical protein
MRQPPDTKSGAEVISIKSKQTNKQIYKQTKTTTTTKQKQKTKQRKQNKTKQSRKTKQNTSKDTN